MPDAYFDVAPAMTGGWRVVYIRGRDLQGQAVFECATDVLAAARLCGVAILTDTAEIRARCRSVGVRLLPTAQDRQQGCSHV